MFSKLKSINTFFDIFDFIKIKLNYMDYNIFIQLFINSLNRIISEDNPEKSSQDNPEESSKNNLEDKSKDKPEDKYNLVILWKFINNIYMMKIYDNITKNIKSENFSILCENNNLCKEMLFNIINNDFFDGEYFLGLYDYIFFEDRFILEKQKMKKIK